MQAVLRNSMAAVLLIHALLGCCWHHAHAAARGGAGNIEARPGCCCCDDHAGRPLDQRQPAPAERPAKCHGICVYLPPQRTDVAATAHVLPFDAAIAALTLAADFRASAAAWDVSSARHDLQPPVRLHLLHQSLLI